MVRILPRYRRFRSLSLGFAISSSGSYMPFKIMVTPKLPEAASELTSEELKMSRRGVMLYFAPMTSPYKGLYETLIRACRCSSLLRTCKDLPAMMIVTLSVVFTSIGRMRVQCFLSSCLCFYLSLSSLSLCVWSVCFSLCLSVVFRLQFSALINCLFLLTVSVCGIVMLTFVCRIARTGVR